MQTLTSLNPLTHAKRNVTLQRHASVSDALRQRELQWWAEFGVAEERYFWGLIDSWQPPSRMRYFAHMAQSLGACTHVIDYGCGSGWLTRALADRLQRPVTGLDFSPAQIDLSTRRHADCPWTLFSTIGGPQDLPRADGYVFHGLLHHLGSQEIHDLLGRLASHAMPGARAIFVEPVCFPGHVPQSHDRVLIDVIEELVKEPWRVAEARAIEIPEAVRHARVQGESRWWGEAPYGPSPMERPFEANEFGQLMGSYFEAAEVEYVQFLPASQALAAELALLTDAAPELAADIAPSLMAQMDALERVVLRLPKRPDTGWYMALAEVRIR